MASAQSAAGDDSSFGPRYGDAVDVTLTFSNVIFTIVPSCLLLLAGAVHMQHYYRRPIVAVRSNILWARMATAICILGLSIAASVSWCTNSTYNTPTSIPAAVMFSLSAAALSAMIWIEHCKSTQSSFTASFYILISMFLDAARARSFSMRPGLEAASGLMGAVAALKFTLAVLFEFKKQLTPELEARKLAQELTCGYLNRTFMAWINNLLVLGFRRNLTLDDLNSLDDTYSTRQLDQEFTKIWDKEPKTERALAKAFIRMFGVEVLLACIPQAVNVACDFATVYIMQRILVYLASPDSSDSFTPGGLIAATALGFFGVMVGKNASITITNRVSVKVRSTIFALVAKKVMRLPISKADKSTALTHISADADGITNPINQLPGSLVAPFQLAVALYSIYTVVGKVVILCVPPSLLFFMASIIVTAYVPGARKRWNGGIDTRVSCSTTVLSQLRNIKIVGLAPSMGRQLQSLREAEIELSKKQRKISILSWSTSPLQFSGVPVAMVAGAVFWTRQQAVLDPAVVYPMLTFSWMAANALNECRLGWPQFASTLASLSRVQSFLLQDERKDPRTIQSLYSEKSGTSAEKSEEPTAISAADVSVAGKDDNAHKVLSGITVEIAKSSLVLLIGSVGSGKSVFLKTLLGETNLSSGTIRINTSSVAYCGQSPWIPRGTAREVIIGESSFEEAWYQTVVQACALDQDFARIPEGDESPTGTNGNSLSGGQIRRLGLARAIYSRAALLLCDDVLSALDKPTSAHIFHELFGAQGLLRKQGRTVVLATHSIEWLDDADQIVLFEEGQARVCDRSEITTDIGQTILARGSGDEDVSTADGGSVSDKDNGPEPLETARMTTEWSLYRFFLGPVPWYLLWPTIIAIVLMGFMERCQDLYIRIWLSVGPENHHYYFGMVAMTVMAIVVNASAIYLYFIRTIRITSNAIHERFVDTVMNATLPFVTATNTGAILNKFCQDMTLVGQLMPYELMMVIYVLELVVQHTVLIAAGAQYAGLMIPVVLVIIYYLQLFYLQSSRQMRMLDLESQTPLYTKISESTAGLEHIRAFGWEEEILDRIYEHSDNAAKPFYYLYTIQRWLMLVLNGLGFAMAVILVAISLSFTQTTTGPSLGLALIGAAEYGGTVEVLVVCWTGLETSLGAVRRIKAFVEDTPTEVDKPTATPPAANWPSRGRVVLTDVSCAYSDDEKAPLALQNITFTVEAGQKAIVVGRTGSGKSSLLLTILHCLHHTGDISIDGIDITDVTHDGLREAITTISQEPINLPGSVKDNLAPKGFNSGGVDENELWSVLELVRLSDHVTKNGGLDAPLSDMHLSVGQKQLMSMARAIVHQRHTKGKLVLMDEVTSNMDYDTDELIQDVLDTAFADCTRIIISHRQSNSARYDIVISLEDGKLAGVETWAERNQGAATASKGSSSKAA